MKQSPGDLLPPPDLNEVGRSRVRTSGGAKIRWKHLLVLAVVAVVAASATWIAKYDPLYPAGARFAGAPGVRAIGENTFGYRQGAEFFYGFTLFNEGRWGITISNPIPDRDRGILHLLEARVERGDSCCRWEDADPFEPFALHPHGSATILIRAVMTDRCQRMNTSGGPVYSPNKVEYRFLGIPHRSEVEGPEFRILLEKQSDCPNA